MAEKLELVNDHNAERLGRLFDGGAGGGNNGGMEARLTHLEAIIPTLATREDVARLEGKMHQEINTQTWKFVSWMTGICGAMVAAVYFIARNVS